jgi:hypothetical protein
VPSTAASAACAASCAEPQGLHAVAKHTSAPQKGPGVMVNQRQEDSAAASPAGLPQPAYRDKGAVNSTSSTGGRCSVPLTS